MSWTEIARAQYRRDGLRYASDTTDAEWGLLAPLLPAPRRVGRPRTVDLRAVLVHVANIQDNHGAVPLLRSLGRQFPKLRHIFADRVYRGQKLLDALADLGKWTIEIVTRSQSIGTFKAEPKRWVIERTLAWLGRNRRLAKDFEATIARAQP